MLAPSLGLALAAERLGPAFGRPNSLLANLSNSLREFASRAACAKQKAARGGLLFCYGGGGENRTRVRKPYIFGSTCVVCL